MKDVEVFGNHEVIAGNYDEGKKTLVLCLPGEYHESRVEACIDLTIAWFSKRGWNVMLRSMYRANVFACRNDLFGMLKIDDLVNGRQPKVFEGNVPTYEYMMWIDDDMLWTPMQIQRLMQDNKDIIGGLAKMSAGDQFAVVEKWNHKKYRATGTYQYLDDESMKERFEPFPVAFTGMAFLLIKKGVVEKFDYPWVEPYVQTINGLKIPTGEDVSFCKKAQRFGFKVWVDPLVTVGHLKRRIIY